MNGRGFFDAVVRDSRPRAGGGGLMAAASVEAPEVVASEGRARTDMDQHGRPAIAPEAPPKRGRVVPAPLPVSLPLPIVPEVASPISSEPLISLPAAAPVPNAQGRGFLPPGRGRLETGGGQEGGAPKSTIVGARNAPLLTSPQSQPSPSPGGGTGETGETLPPALPELDVQPSPGAPPRRSQDVGAGLAPAREGVNPAPTFITFNEKGSKSEPGEAVPRAKAEPAAAPERAVVTEQSLLVTPTRVVPSGSEPAGGPRPVSRQETVLRSEGPRVHIGVVEIVVAASAEKRAPAAAAAPSSNLASRRYLRSL
ncbi:MAG: hypothetical protein QOH06_5386 [Acidobacteriota bacterium]|nr:hypothetical protein [Acidobacteriota bacterium]